MLVQPSLRSYSALIVCSHVRLRIAIFAVLNGRDHSDQTWMWPYVCSPRSPRTGGDAARKRERSRICAKSHAYSLLLCHAHPSFRVHGALHNMLRARMLHDTPRMACRQKHGELEAGAHTMDCQTMQHLHFEHRRMNLPIDTFQRLTRHYNCLGDTYLTQFSRRLASKRGNSESVNAHTLPV